MTYEEIWHRLAVVYSDGEAKAQARMLLEDKFGLSLADILCGGVGQLSADDTMWLERAVARIEQMEPIQYVLSLIHISEPTRPAPLSRMPSSA